MKYKFEQLSNKVIKSADGKQFFSKAESAVDFQKTFFGDEEQYEISGQVAEIELKNHKGAFTDAIILTFCKEDDESTSFVDVLISDLLGTFISDWY